ncbi:MAG: OmpA family protein [Verrucomicrobiota bacterium]|nr:OmpA family protein [Verrucomicrobiota bacterium]
MNETHARASWWDLLEWRLDAWRTGKSFAQIAAERSLVFRVDQLFLVHRATGRWLLHIAADPAIADDSASLAELLIETEDFIRHLFFPAEESAVEEFFVGEKRVWIAPGAEAYLAAVISGEPPDDLKATIKDANARLHAEYATALAAFNGNSSVFAKAAPILTACLRAEYRPTPQLERVKLPQLPRPRVSLPRVTLPRLTSALPFAAAALAVLLIAALFAWRAEAHWRDFVGKLKAEPGLLVGATEHHWIARSRVAGFRDPLAQEPAAIARETKVNPARVRFEWKEYVAADSAIVQRRFVQRFGLPGEASVQVVGETVQISGRVPNEWLERVRREATEVTGVKSLAEREVKIVYDPNDALEQFKTQFAPPPGVRVSLTNNTLVLSGRAPFEWLVPVREGARKIPGITSINGDDLVLEFDPKLVLNRFRDQFGLPDGVNASVQGGRLIITGDAPHAWLDQVRRGAVRVAGVRVLDDRNVHDIDQREFEETKTRIDAASVLFILNRDAITPEASAVIARLAEDVRRCLGAARNMGVNVVVEVRAYGDAVGSEEANAELSRRRADAVRSALVSGGLEERKIKSVALGTPPPPGPWEKSGAGQFDRRVFFKVVIQP